MTYAPRADHGVPGLAGVRGLLTADGGVCQGTADLWCSYAATRTLSWLGASPDDPDACATYVLGCANSDGGFGWQKGMRSDVWSTYYCTQTLIDLSQPIPRASNLAAWLADLGTPEGGFAMTPGQPPDLWATYYAVRTYRDVAGQEPPRARRLAWWIAASQRPRGGFGWTPEDREADARACFYAIMSLAELGREAFVGVAWNRAAAARWLRDRQTPAGGFSFGESHTAPCVWATYRAASALAALDTAPRDRTACLSWIARRKAPDTGFRRWEKYPVADVWACFSAVGAVRALGASLDRSVADDVIGFLRSCQLPGSGFTYREPADAGDSLATSAACVLAALEYRHTGSQAARALAAQCAVWLRRAQMPYEDGVMYMPARGAEVRCTLWAIVALDVAAEVGLDRSRLLQWFDELQNPDGGFGYWHGRGSDVVATVSALESLEYLGTEPSAVLNAPRCCEFLRRCEAADGVRFAPRGESMLATTCQGIRGMHLLGMPDAARLVQTIAHHGTPLGGFAARPRGFPDLISTYQAVLTLQTLGVQWDAAQIKRLLDRLRRDGGYAWSPLSEQAGGPLAACLGALLQEAVSASWSGMVFALPKLNL